MTKRISHDRATRDLEIIVMHSYDGAVLRAAERLERYINQQRKRDPEKQEDEDGHCGI